MTKEQVEKLEANAQDARRLFDEINSLRSLIPKVTALNLSFKDWNTGDEFLSKTLLMDVFVAGIHQVVKEKERGLSTIPLYFAIPRTDQTDE